ncbi:MAG: ABC transporter permease [Acetanaerobacterium sp.]
MGLWENILLSLSGLLSNKMRALLTMLGIIIGIGSVIGIMTIGDSLTGYMSSSMQDMGANNITLSLSKKESEADSARANPMLAMMGGGSGKAADKDLFTDDLLKQLGERYPDQIEAISISESVGSGKTEDGRLYANLSLMGVNNDYQKANTIDLLQGRFLNERDQNGFKKVAVVSEKLVANMFGKKNPMGEQIDITVGKHTNTYTIVGVYEYVASTMGISTASDRDISTNVYIPLSTAQKQTGSSGYQSATLLTSINTESTIFATMVEKFFEPFYARNPDYSVSAFSMESLVETMSSMLSTMQIAISCIAAISLLVGGIGVMNIMLVSITERTREIGTRKALGATNFSIQIQFIVESVIICLIGGIIGILLGIALGTFGASLLGFPATASVGTILLAVGFSMAIGVFFGYYPANKAAKMDPIEALRYE